MEREIKMDVTSIKLPNSLANITIDLEAIAKYAKHAKKLARLPRYGPSIIKRDLDKNGCYRY